jgi:hypothetical protein
MTSHVHCRVVSPQVIQPQDGLFRYIGDKLPNIQSALPQSQLSQRLSHDWDRPSRTHLRLFYDWDRSSRTNLQNALSARPPLWQSHDDVWPCDSHECPSVSGHTARLFLHPATSLSSVLVQEPVLKLLPPDTHGIHTLLKSVFNVVPLGRHTCRFEVRRNVR